MQFKSYAKINLALDVLKKDESGFHQIQTVFYEYPDLYDEIEMESAENIVVDCYWKITENSAFKAAKLLQKVANVTRGAHINIKKKIPLGSGLGGAASNAATVLKGLNQMWQLNYSKEELAQIGAEIGKDVPFFIYGGLALGANYGEKITVLDTDLKLKIKVLWPDTPMLTNEAYASLDLNKCALEKDKTEVLIEALRNNDEELLIANIHNDFETLALPPSEVLKKQLYQAGAKRACLSGSGSAVFAIF